MRKRSVDLLSMFWPLKKRIVNHTGAESKTMGRAKKSQVNAPVDPVTGNSIYPEYFPWV
ncbi:hypothetical protein [Pseudomonas sp. A-R-19]|uniref:hypothetical protein n=1 Tax=Pseudomonas sp. A-R-19 TaxID=2832403 RepID=UPI001CBA9864|nr:hypothetical protein [Pseudomonas sp. A-R-19]